MSREKLISAIESIHNMNVGLRPKLVLNYSPTDHKGFDSVYPTIVRDGKPVLITDWSALSK